MGWNGSNSTGMASSEKSRAANPSSRPSNRLYLRGALAGVILVGAGIVTLYLVSRKETKVVPKPVVKSVQMIQAATNVPVATSKPVITETVRRTPTGTIIPKHVELAPDGVYRYPSGLAWYDSNTVSRAKSTLKRRIFKRMCDNKIASIITMDPARMAPVLIGHRRPFDQRFLKDFKESLSEVPGLPQKDDTPEDKELRKLVSETRLELKDAMDRGEDIVKIMNDAQNELDRLAQYRNNLKKELAKVDRNESYSDADVADYLKAANTMLEKQGLKKLTMPGLVNRQARFSLLHSRKDQKNSK